MHLVVYAFLMGGLLKVSHVLSQFCTLDPNEFTMLRFVLTGAIAAAVLLYVITTSNNGIRKKHNTRDYWIVVLSAVFYVAGIYMLIKGYGLYGVAGITMVSNIITTLMGLAIGYVIFKERFSGLQIAGAMLMIVGLFLFGAEGFRPLTAELR